MASDNISRAQILESLQSAFQPLDFIHAMWQGGAAAFDRVDQWSDIDLQIDVDDDRVEEVFAIAESALESLSPIDIRYRIPEPTWHGHSQAFYRLEDASPYLLVDFTVIRHSNSGKFTQPEVHGNARVHFDRDGVTIPSPMDMEELGTKLVKRLETLRSQFDLFRILTQKELNRGNNIEALSFYQGFVLRPLVEALRIRHAPARSGFHTRYLYYDLPRDLVETLESLFFVSGAEDLARKFQEAESMFEETLRTSKISDRVKIDG